MNLTADDLFLFLEKELGVDTGDLNQETPLFSSGVIDSFALVKLITYLEDRLDMRFAAADVTLENLDSVERILAYLSKR